MKAEQRKELETNTLADKVGQAMQRVKGGSRRSALIYFVSSAAIILAIFFAYRWWLDARTTNSAQWLMLDNSSGEQITALARTETVAGRAAKFQIAWILYWEEGVRMIGPDPIGSMKKIAQAGNIYKDLAKECEDADDKIFEPQALLGIAVCEETRAVQDLMMLDRAKESYGKVVQKYKDSAEGVFAQKRLDQMSGAKLKEMESVYTDLQKSLQVPALQQGIMPPGFPEGVIKGDEQKDKKK